MQQILQLLRNVDTYPLSRKRQRRHFFFARLSIKEKKRIWTQFWTQIWKIFCWNYEVWALQKYVHFVDFVQSFHTKIYLHKLTWIRLRTNRSKFADTSSLPNPMGHTYRPGNHCLKPWSSGWSRGKSVFFVTFLPHPSYLHSRNCDKMWARGDRRRTKWMWFNSRFDT